MSDAAFVAAMKSRLPEIPAPDPLAVVDCTGIFTGNADLELSDAERIGTEKD